jgi:hypothetical protein
MLKSFKHIKDVIQGKAKFGEHRSNLWPRIRKAWLAKYPRCQVCGGKKKLEVHHKQPFHLHPDLELSYDNLITLCESKQNGLSCHQLIGHLGDFHSINVGVETDAQIWANKIKGRP